MIRGRADFGQRALPIEFRRDFLAFSGRVRWFGAVMRKLSGSLGFLLVVLLSGCSAGNVSNPTSTPAPAVRGLQGVVHGGQPPVTGAAIKLWAAGAGGDGSTGTLLTSANSDSNGNFTLGTYTCPVPNPYVYLTATGGN